MQGPEVLHNINMLPAIIFPCLFNFFSFCDFSVIVDQWYVDGLVGRGNDGSRFMELNSPEAGLL